MLVMLPNERNGLSRLLKSLTSNADDFGSIFDKGKYWRTLVHLGLPKFSIHGSTIPLVEELTSMGLGSLFGSEADLSGITGSHDITVSSILHKALIDVSGKVVLRI